MDNPDDDILFVQYFFKLKNYFHVSFFIWCRISFASCAWQKTFILLGRQLKLSEMVH